MTRRSRLIAQCLILGLAVAQGLDVMSTNAALAATPGAFEGNPVQAFLMAHLGSYWWIEKAFLAAFFIYVALTLTRMNKWTWALLATCAKTYAIVILCNFFHLI
ncbi:MAG TPA: DUF5658 family protein [Aliidongia sp.]|nr:DUF5658 family protein [Aliidongia sp.]